jgi:hypothetical protein
MPIFAISLMAILALVGATLALGMDSRSGHQVQQAADSAALGGATAFLNANSPRAETRLEAARVQAEALAERNSDYELAKLDIAAVSEDAYGQHTKLAVELEFQPVNYFSRFTGKASTVPVRRRAVASSTWGFPLCMLALSDLDHTGLSLKHLARLESNGCIVWSNASGRSSMAMDGGRAEAKSFCTAGRVDRSHRASVSPLPEQNCQVIPDPLADWVAPKPGACEPDPDFRPPLSIRRAAERLLGSEKSKKSKKRKKHRGRDDDDDDDDDDDHDDDEGGCRASCKNTDHDHYCGGQGPDHEGTGAGLSDFDLLALTDNLLASLYALDRQYDQPTDTLNPGTYCGLDIAYGHVRMNPGTYFIKGAPLEVSRKATLSAEGVTIILTGPNAYFRVGDQARMTLKAPAEGPLAGIAVAERRNTRVSGMPVVSRLTGTGAMSIIGLLYLPTQNFFISGSGAGDQSSPLLQIVANRIALRDNGELRIDFEPGATDVPVAIKPARIARLIE